MPTGTEHMEKSRVFIIYDHGIIDEKKCARNVIMLCPQIIFNILVVIRDDLRSRKSQQ